MRFRTKFAEDIFAAKYSHDGMHTWDELASRIVSEGCEDVMPK